MCAALGAGSTILSVVGKIVDAWRPGEACERRRITAVSTTDRPCSGHLFFWAPYLRHTQGSVRAADPSITFRWLSGPAAQFPHLQVQLMVTSIMLNNTDYNTHNFSWMMSRNSENGVFVFGRLSAHLRLLITLKSNQGCLTSAILRPFFWTPINLNLHFHQNKFGATMFDL